MIPRSDKLTDEGFPKPAENAPSVMTMLMSRISVNDLPTMLLAVAGVI